MATLLIVNHPKEWAFDIPNVQVVSAKSYLFDPEFKRIRYARVFNLCKSYRYQSMGYYVSLLASARGHRPMPSIQTIQDFKSQTILRVLSDDLQQLIETTLEDEKCREITIPIFFGQTPLARFEKLAYQLFKLFPAPLLKAQFHKNGKWKLDSLTPTAASDISEDQKSTIKQCVLDYLTVRRTTTTRAPAHRFDLAILHNPTEANAPSDEKALQKFIRAAESIGISAELIQKDDYGHIAEFDGLFIRETTSVNHHTYRFARRAMAEGLVVVDDPQSILKCTNKVYLAELLEHNRIPTPKTVVISKDHLNLIPKTIGTPCILKQPDSSFSQGVVRIDAKKDLEFAAQVLFEKSDLVIAQEYMPTEFDWRVGVFDQKVLYVCRYYMAPKHWQIIKQSEGGKRYGKVDSMDIQQAPPAVIRLALQAANLIGDSFYGVDIKQVGDKLFVIEVNDNPNVDSGYEDSILKSELYGAIMGVFLNAWSGDGKEV